jgi:hypothetical protein
MWAGGWVGALPPHRARELRASASILLPLHLTVSLPLPFVFAQGDAAYGAYDEQDAAAAQALSEGVADAERAAAEEAAAGYGQVLGSPVLAA